MNAANSSVFDEILSRNELKAPDGRPVYAYRIQPTEFNAIITTLKPLLSHVPARAWSDQCAALFCIFVADWWRTSYDGSGWSWGAPAEMLGMGFWNSTDLATLTEAGLKHLKRNILELESGKRYLGTLATEGGLPLKVIPKEQAALASAFRSIFQDLRTFGAQFRDPTELGEAERHRLSKTFQQATGISTLIGELALTVWRLAPLVEGQDDPLTQLDRITPNWRQELPLEVSDAQARELLKLILGDARKIHEQVGGQITVYRQLRRKGDGTFTLIAQIDTPPRIRVVALAHLLGLDEDELPFRIKLKARSNGQERLFAHASRISPETYRIEFFDQYQPFEHTLAAGNIRLVGYAGESEISQEYPLIGEGLSDEPWIFVDDSIERDCTPNEAARMFSTGSVSTRRELVLVALTENETHKQDSSDGIIEEVGALDDERTIYRIMGCVVFHDADDTRWRIRCDTSDDEHINANLRGELWDFEHTHGRPCYTKDLRIWLDDAIIDNAKIMWRQGQREIALPLGSFGDGQLRLYDEDRNLIMQRSITLLPRSASVHVRAATNNASGAVRLRDFGDVARVGVTRKGVHTSFAAKEGNYEVEFVLNHPQAPPARVDLVIEWEEGTCTTLKVPYPSGRAAFRYADNLLAHHSGWLAHSVHELHAEYTSSTVEKDKPYLIGKLIANDVTQAERDAVEFRAPLRVEVVRGQMTGRATLSLIRVRDYVEQALACTMDLEARVELSLEWLGGSTSAMRKLNLYRYEGPIEANETQTIFKPISRSNLNLTEETGSLQLVAFRFQEPDIRHDLIACSDGTWLADSSNWQPGTWCVLGVRDHEMSHRPKIFRIEGTIETSEWARVCEIRGQDVRRDAFVTLYKNATGNSEHEVWERLEQVFKLAAELPATTFDALDRLSTVPEACAHAFATAGEDIERWWSELEELPFMWHLISLRDWRDAIVSRLSSIPKSLRRSIGDQAFVKNLVQHTAHQLGRDFVAFAFIAEHLQIDLGVDSSDLKSAQDRPPLVRFVRQQEFTDLIQRRDPDRCNWPDHWAALTCLPNELHDDFNRFKLRDAPQSWQCSVADAPVVAALACAFGVRLERADVMWLRKLRQFDRKWFDFAYQSTLGLIIAETPASQLL